MASQREIRGKIKTIKGIRKITNAMQMVAASKMRKAQERRMASHPYAIKILEVIDHLSQANPQYQHPYMVQREIHRVGYIVIASDRGLCGALNSNILKQVESALKQWSLKKIAVDLCLIGNKADVLSSKHGKVVVKMNHIGDEGGIQQLIGGIKVMLDAYKNGHIDALYLSYSEFVNTMTQRPKIQQLLPIPFQKNNLQKYKWDYIYEPGSIPLLDLLLSRYMESQIYQSAVESIASEHSARMIAMKNASDNANQLMNTFQLSYNKARQAAITNEIAEVVGGTEGLR